MNYVLDSVPGTDGHLWWHARREEVTHLTVAQPSDARRFVTRCGALIESADLRDGSRILTDWLAEFGDDVDLCWCAVTSPEDAARMAALVAENAHVTPA